MKTFLNVLYRRILYKIPLKLLLVLLAIFGLLFACTKAEMVITNNEYTEYINSKNFYIGNHDLVCVYNLSCANGKFCFTSNTGYGGQCINFNINEVGGIGYCGTTNAVITTLANCSYGVNYVDFNNYSSQQCQSEYNLIPINEVDSSYCQSNNLCPSGGTPSDCPNIGVSNLFINDIFHPGAFNIIMNIPEEISRDYAYTNSGNNFNLDIEGYNVDYEKMQSVIDNQSYIPTEEDFQNIISILTPYTKIIVFFVFLFIVWAWIKKPFKSKKL